MSSTKPARLLLLVACAAFAGCNSGSLTSAHAGSGNAATVQFVNATGGSLDLATAGALTAGNIVSGAGVRCFTVTDPVAPALSVRQAGTSTNLSGFAPTLVAGGRYTVVAYPGAAGTVQFVTVTASPPVASGRSAIRVVQGSSALGPVDVYLTAPGAPLGSPVAAGLGYGGVSATFDVSAGGQQVRLTGTGASNIVYDTGTQALASGIGYTLIVSSVTAPLLVPDC